MLQEQNNSLPTGPGSSDSASRAPTGNSASRDLIPASSVTDTLRRIWAHVLNAPYIEDDATFFDLGGNRSSMNELALRVSRVFRVELSLLELFDDPTVSGMAGRIATALQGQEATNSLTVPVMSNGLRPLSLTQEGVWFRERMKPGNPVHHVSLLLRFDGPLYLNAVGESLNALVRRHESLRTTFCLAHGRPGAMVRPAQPVALPFQDLSHLSIVEAEDQALAQVQEETRHPFSLELGPLLRASLFRLQRDEHLLLLTLHDIIADTWSLNVLVKEFALFYQAFVDGREPMLADLPHQYTEFARWQRERLKEQRAHEDFAYWRRQLADSPPLVLPLDYARPTGPGRPAGTEASFEGCVRSDRINRELMKALQRVSDEEDVTLFAFLFAAFVALLYHYTGQGDISVGTLITDRSWFGAQWLVGILANTVILRTNPSGCRSFRELLAQVQQVTEEAIAHQDLPYTDLAAATQLEAGLASSEGPAHWAPVRALFNLRREQLPSYQLGELMISPVELDQGAVQYDLTWTVVEGARSHHIRVEYSSDLFEATTIDEMLGDYLMLLEQMVVEPGAELHDLATSLAKAQEPHKA